MVVTQQERIHSPLVEPIFERACGKRASRVHEKVAHVPCRHLVTRGRETTEDKFGATAMVLNGQVQAITMLSIICPSPSSSSCLG